MPIFDFTCSGCGMKFENLFLANDELVDSVPCTDCESEARRVKLARFRVVGPVFEHMEHYESALLSPADRRNGARFKSGKDIERWEQDRGLSRMPHGSSQYNQYVEKSLYDAHTMSSLKKTDGKAAVADWIEKTEVMDSTSLTDSQYTRYKELSDAAESNARTAVVDGTI